MATLFSDSFNRADNVTVDATNWVETTGGNWEIVSNTLRSSTAGAIICTTSAHAAAADCKATITLASIPAGFDGGPMIRCTTTDGQNGYFLDYDSSGNTLSVWRRVSNADAQVGANITSFSASPGDTLTLEGSGTGATVTIKAYKNGVQQGSNFTDSSGSRITSAGQAGVIMFAGTNATLDNFLWEDLAGAAPATLSGPTPSGTIGTTTTATVGATSDTSTGTFYAVLSTTNNVATATATQIKAGQNSTGAAAAFASNSAVSTTSPSTGFSGLTAATTYFYAAVQNSTGGDSNVVSGSFTTAAASSSTNQRLTLLGVS